MSHSPVVFTYGAGRNSKAALAEMVSRGERVDLIIFSDPGAEDPDTYADLEIFEQWLIAHHYPAITRVRYTTETGRVLTIEQDCRERHTLPAIAFGWKSCSEKYKQRPQHKYVKQWAPAVDAWKRGEPVTKIVGYHALETGRVDAAQAALRTQAEKLKEPRPPRYVLRFPLVEWGWSNVDCINSLRDKGLEVPPKSSCYFCPSKKVPEILKMKRRHLALYERALEIEDDARAHGVEMAGLGRRFSWRDVTAGTKDAQVSFPCACFDAGGDDDDEEAA